jgi:hypothetical protein
VSSAHPLTVKAGLVSHAGVVSLPAPAQLLFVVETTCCCCRSFLLCVLRYELDGLRWRSSLTDSDEGGEGGSGPPPGIFTM